MKILQAIEVPKRPTTRTEGIAKYCEIVNMVHALEVGQALCLEPNDIDIDPKAQQASDFLRKARTNIASTIRRHVSNPLRRAGKQVNYMTYSHSGCILIKRRRDGEEELTQVDPSETEAIEAEAIEAENAEAENTES